MAPADSKQACLAVTTEHLSYMQAVKMVQELPMFKAWSASLPEQHRVAMVKATDKTEFIDQHCFWSISFYESESMQLHLWRIFRVDVENRLVLMMNDDGEYVLVQ